MSSLSLCLFLSSISSLVNELHWMNKSNNGKEEKNTKQNVSIKISQRNSSQRYNPLHTLAFRLLLIFAPKQAMNTKQREKRAKQSHSATVYLTHENLSMPLLNLCTILYWFYSVIFSFAYTLCSNFERFLLLYFVCIFI